MSSPLLQPLTVLFVSPNGRVPGGRPLDAVDPAIQAEVTASISEAVDRLADSDPGNGGIDAVVCEHGPPAVDAVKFVTSVRRTHSSLPLVVVPADGGTDCTDAALSAGATDVVQASSSSLSPAVLANRIRHFARPGGEAPSTAPATDEQTIDEDQRSNEAGGTRSDDPESHERAVDERLGRLNEGIQEIRKAGRRDTVADALAAAATDLLEAPGVGVFLFDDEENLLVPESITDPMVAFYGGETVFGPGKPDSITWQVFVAGESMLFDDIRTSGVHVNEETAARSSVFVPLGEHGVLVASTDVVGSFSERSRQVVEVLAATAEATLDRVQSTAVLRQHERRVRQLDDRVEYYGDLTDLVRSVERAVVAAETREELESAVLDRLVAEDWFEFAWIGAVDSESGELVPREWTDDGSQYLDELSLGIDGCEEPACRASREWVTAVEPNVAGNLDGDGWERDALSHDFHSVLSVPLVYDGVSYGVLTAYADRPDAFQDPLASIVEEIGETTAYAINALERTSWMLSSGVTELELGIDHADDVLNVVAERLGSTVECRELTPLPDGSTKVLFSVTDVSAESVLTTMTGLVAVDSVTHVGRDGAHLFSAVVEGGMAGSVIATSGGVPEQITADDSSLEVTVHVPDSLDARTFVDRLERRYPDTTLRARREQSESALTRSGFLNDLESALTERQLEVLETAYESGFFSSPRDATGQDVADRLDVSQPTVSHHLRASQGTLFSMLFGEE